MQLYFIRHAQSFNNALTGEDDSAENRREDPELTDLGRQQAEKLAEFLKSGNPFGGRFCQESAQEGFQISRLYTSLMVRSVATGAVVAKKLGLPLVAWVNVHERGGIYLEDPTTGEVTGLPGKDRAYFEEQFPGLRIPEDDMQDSGWWDGRPFEQREQWPERARGFLKDLLERHGGTGDRVALISHGGFYNDFLRILLGLPAGTDIWFTLFNAGITRIDFNEDRTSILYHNRMDYLPPELIT